jgi:hypothetical protein
LSTLLRSSFIHTFAITFVSDSWLTRWVLQAILWFRAFHGGFSSITYWTLISCWIRSCWCQYCSLDLFYE